MPMPTLLRNTFQSVYDAAEASPNKQAVVRITVLGAVYKILVNLERFPEEIIVRIKKRS